MEITKSKSFRLSRKQSESLVAYGFLSIPMALFLFLSIGIFFYAIYISTYDWGIMGPTKSV